MVTNQMLTLKNVFIALLAALIMGIAGEAQTADYPLFTFPIATTTGREAALSAAFDGTNYLVGIQGDATAGNPITAQLVSSSGALTGSRILLGRTGGIPNGIAFDGTNYLMVWSDDASSPNNKLYGGFIRKDGSLAGVPFAIDSLPLTTGRKPCGLAFGGGQYLAVYYKKESTSGRDIVYGRLISPAGSVGNEIRISSGFGSQGEQTVAFDGTRFFVVWVNDDTDDEIKGRFVTTAGSLGPEVTVKPRGRKSDNPLSLGFDGTNYLVAWTEEISDSNWDIFGQVVTPAGDRSGGVISISTAPGQQFFPLIAFDGSNYLVSWTDMKNDLNGNGVCDAGEGTCSDVYGQFISKTGALVDAPFIIHNGPGNGIGGFSGQAVNGKLFGLINTGVDFAQFRFGDVLGVFLTSGSTSGTVSFSGTLTRFSDEAPVNLGVIALEGTPTRSTLTNSLGHFTLTNLPGDTEFTLKMTKPISDTTPYIPTYSAILKFEQGAAIDSARDYTLFTQADLNSWSVAAGRGAIRGRVLNSANMQAGYISGAVVTYTSSKNASYRVIYENPAGTLVAGTGTFANGKYYILDVVEGDRVVVSATRTGYTFTQPRAFITHSNAVSLGSVTCQAASGRVAIGGSITDATAATLNPIKGALVEQAGAASPLNATISNADGSWFLTVPKSTPIHLKFSKASDSSLARTASAHMTFESDGLNTGEFNLFPLTRWGTGGSNWNMSLGKGIIRSRVRDQAGNNLAGAVVSCQSTKYPVNPPYQICYTDDCTNQSMTLSDGRYLIKHVEEGDTITVTATKSGHAFTPRKFSIYGGTVHQGTISATANSVNGICGPAQGQFFSTAPATGLCSTGTPTAVAGQGPWTWICSGSGGGADASCSAGIQEPSPAIFREDFSGTVLDLPWQVVSGRGRYSLTQTSNPGHLRYYLEGPQAYSGSALGVVSSWSPSLTLIRPFNGDNWVLRTKAHYNIFWPDSGAQYNNFYIAFGQGNSHYLRISRGTDQWYGTNILSAELVSNGQTIASSSTMRSPNDVVAGDWLRYAYWYEIVRHGQQITLRYSYDGTLFTTAFSTLLSTPVEAVQRAVIDANVWATAGSYTDWDYIHVDTATAALKGDVNNDGRITLADALSGSRVLAGASSTDAVIGADINNEGKIGLAEVIYVLQKLGQTRTEKATGTYSWSSANRVISLNWTGSNFVCEGPELGTESQNGVTITSTTMIWPDNGMTWTRPTGTANLIVGTWKSVESSTGNSWTLTFNANGTVSVAGVILMCE